MVIPMILFPSLGIFFYVLSYVSTDKKNQLVGIVTMSISMGILGYLFKDPMTDPDLVRYIDMVKDYGGMTLLEIFDSGKYTNMYVIDLWFWLVSITENYQFLPASVAFITYYIYFVILSSYCNANSFGVKYRAFCLCLLLSLVNFALVVNAIRSVVSFTLFLYAVYREYYLKHKDILTYFCYLIPIFMHFAILILLIIRLFLSFIKKYKIMMCLCILLSPFFLELIIDILLILPESLPLYNTLLEFLTRVLMYFRWNTGGWASTVADSGYYFLNKVFSITTLMIATISRYYLNKSKGYIWNKEFDAFFEVYCAIAFACFYMATPTYQRFTLPCWVFCICIFISLFEQITNKFYKVMYISIILILSLLGAFLEFYMINTMIPLVDYFKNIIIFSPITYFLYLDWR